MMDQFVVDLTSEWKALGLPLNPKLGACQPASCAYCRCKSNPKLSTNQNVPSKTCTLQATSWVCATGSTWVPSCINRPGLPSGGTCHSCCLASYHLRLQVTLTFKWFKMILVSVSCFWRSTILNDLCHFRGKQGGGRDPNIWFPWISRCDTISCSRPIETIMI